MTATSDAKEVIIDVTASFDANESNIPKKSKDSTEKSDMTGDVSSLDVNHVMETTEPNVERSKMACKCGPFWRKKEKKNYNIIHLYFDLVCIWFHERRDLFIGFENK